MAQKGGVEWARAKTCWGGYTSMDHVPISMTYDDVLVPTDGSPGMQGAIARAVDIARLDDATVHSLYVADTETDLLVAETEAEPVVRRALEERGRDATLEVTRVAENHGLTAENEVREGIPYQEILAYSHDADIDLVVMGNRSAGEGDQGVGSTTERVAVVSEAPVLSVPFDDDSSVTESRYTMYDHILVPTDGSDPADRAADLALDIAEQYGADVHAVYVVDTTTYGSEDTPRSIIGLLKEGGANAVEAVAVEARDRNLPVTTDVLRGVPEAEILEYAAGVDADMIAVGTRGRGATPNQVLGSITGRVLQQATMPVLTVG
jgi:nucleotide-binding universal stress UspA family protein